MIANIMHKIDMLLHRSSKEEEQAGAFAHKLDGVKWAKSEENANNQAPAIANDPLADVAYKARPGNPFNGDF